MSFSTLFTDVRSVTIAKWVWAHYLLTWEEWLLRNEFQHTIYWREKNDYFEMSLSTLSTDVGRVTIRIWVWALYLLSWERRQLRTEFEHTIYWRGDGDCCELWIWCLSDRASFWQLKNKNQLDATYYFIILLIGSTCFRHYYAHHQELTIIM